MVSQSHPLSPSNPARGTRDPKASPGIQRLQGPISQPASPTAKSQQPPPHAVSPRRVSRCKSRPRWTNGVDAHDRKARHRPGELLPRQGRRRRRGLLLRRGRGGRRVDRRRRRGAGPRRRGRPDQLKAMLTGRNPVDGEPLLGTSGVPAKGSVPGFDLTFSAPKSVSLLWGLGGAEAAGPRSRPPTAKPSAPPSPTCSARRAGRGAAPAAGSSSKATATSPPPTCTAPRATAIPSCTPTSSSPTRRRGPTAAGPASTTRRSTSTPKPPATSTRPTCATS